MSAECTFKSEFTRPPVSAASELGKLAPPALRAGVLLASIANNVMTNPRNAAIVAVLVIVALPICWYWKRRRGPDPAMLKSLRRNETFSAILLDAQNGHPTGAHPAAVADARSRPQRRAAHAVPARISMTMAKADGDGV
jgi:hypothetical protein